MSLQCSLSNADLTINVYAVVLSENEKELKMKLCT